MRAVFLIIGTLLITQISNCQIRVDTSYFNASQYNSKNCTSYQFKAKVPVFSYYSESLKPLQDSIYAIYKSAFQNNFFPIEFPDQEDAFTIDSCSNKDEANADLIESCEISFNIYFTSDSIISMYILESDEDLGEQIETSFENVYTLNFDLKKGCFINWKTKIPITLIEKSRLLLAKKMNVYFSIDTDSIPEGIPKAEEIETVCMASDKIRVFGSMHLSRHSWFEFVDIPIAPNKLSKRKKK